MSERKERSSNRTRDFADALSRFRSEQEAREWRTAPEQEGAPNEDIAVRRVLVDLEIDGRLEWVELQLSGEEVHARSTAADPDRCIRAALEALQTSGLSVAEGRVSVLPPPPAVPREGEGPAQESSQADLAAALDDLRTAIVRAGAGQGVTAPGYLEAYSRLQETLGKPLPPGATRWLTALRRALASGDLETLCRLFEGAQRLADTCRAEGEGAPFVAKAEWSRDRKRLPRERISDRRAAELARRWVPGFDGGTSEIRYLLCLHSGEIFRESISGSEPLSDGPCPRWIRIGLADVEDTLGVRRIHLLQYTVGSTWSPEIRRRIQTRSESKWPVLLDRYKQNLEAAPGLQETPALVSPKALERFGEGVFGLIDQTGDILALAPVPASEMLAGWTDSEVPSWVFGTLGHAQGHLSLHPHSAFIDSEGGGRSILL